MRVSKAVHQTKLVGLRSSNPTVSRTSPCKKKDLCNIYIYIICFNIVCVVFGTRVLYKSGDTEISLLGVAMKQLPGPLLPVPTRFRPVFFRTLECPRSHHHYLWWQFIASERVKGWLKSWELKNQLISMP